MAVHLNPLTPTVATWVHPEPDRVESSFVIFDIWALWRSEVSVRVPGTLTLRSERQSAWMSKITNDGLTRSCSRCFIAVHIWLCVKGLITMRSTAL